MTLNSASPRRLDRILDSLWHACSAPQMLMLLMALLAGTLALAAAFPQQPPGLEGAALERWLATTAGGYRGTGTFLRAIGAFQLLSSPWTRTILAALAFNLALRVVAQARVVSRQWHSPGILPAPPGLPAQFATLPGSLDAALACAEAVLRPGASRVAVEHDATRGQVYACGCRPGVLGPLLTYLGGLLILAGLLVNDTVGWQASDIALAPGSATTLTQPGNLRVTLNDTGGSGGAFPASVTLEQASMGRTVAVALTHPARWGNIWLSLQATGPALAVTATGSDSRPLLLQSLAPGGEVNQTLHVLFQETQGEQVFAIPTRNLAFRVVSYPALPERGIERPVFLIEGYRGADTTPAFSELVEDRASFLVDGISLTVRRDYFVTLEVAYLPGLLLLLLGCMSMLTGVTLVAYRGPVRAWIGMAADREAVAVAVRTAGRAGSERETERLLQALEARSAGTEPVHGD